MPDALRPKPGQPVYYYLLGKREADMGTPAVGERRAHPEEIQAGVAKVLAGDAGLPHPGRWPC